MNHSLSYTLEPEGDSTLIIRFSSSSPHHPNIEVNACCIELASQLNQAIQQGELHGIREAIPSFNTVGVYYDLDILGEKAFQQIHTLVRPFCEKGLGHSRPQVQKPVIEIPVCYDLEFGLDLASLSEQLHISIEDIIRLHTQNPVRVFMLGFSPGLPYLGLLDEKLNIPRKSTPRLKLPAGSVAIANRQCVIYPFETPGGWHVIGRTPLTLFHPDKTPHTLYQAGDQIVFTPISKDTFFDLYHS